MDEYLRGTDKLLNYIARATENAPRMGYLDYEAGLKDLGAKTSGVMFIGSLSDKNRGNGISEAITACERDTGVIAVRGGLFVAGLFNDIFIKRIGKDRQQNYTLQGLLAGEYAMHTCAKEKFKQIKADCCKKP